MVACLLSNVANKKPHVEGSNGQIFFFNLIMLRHVLTNVYWPIDVLSSLLVEVCKPHLLILNKFPLTMANEPPPSKGDTH